MLSEHSGHAPGCMYHQPPIGPVDAVNPPVSRQTLEAALDAYHLANSDPPSPPVQTEPAPASPADVELVAEEFEPFPLALALLAQARQHCPPGLAHSIGQFLASPATNASARGEGPQGWIPVPPAPPTERDLEDHPSLDAFSFMPGTKAGERLSMGPVMATPPPHVRGFTPPPPRPMASPPYSNGCPHPPMRLTRNARGTTCLDCTSEWPNWPAA